MNVLRSIFPNQAWLLKGVAVFLSMGAFNSSFIVLVLVLVVVLDFSAQSQNSCQCQLSVVRENKSEVETFVRLPATNSGEVFADNRELTTDNCSEALWSREAVFQNPNSDF
jgi:hypothetical protein